MQRWFFLWLCLLALPAAALERVALPITESTAMVEAMQTMVQEASSRSSCLLQITDNSLMVCPADCMIPTSVVGVNNADICNTSLTNTTQWQCRWPTQRVTESVSCNELGQGNGWAGNATVRREYQIQNCGQTVTLTGAPLEIVNASGCSRYVPEYRSEACPAPTNAGIASTLGGILATQWANASAANGGWSGSVGLLRTNLETIAANGTVQTSAHGAWAISSINCTRTVQTIIRTACHDKTFSRFEMNNSDCNEGCGARWVHEQFSVEDSAQVCTSHYTNNSITTSGSETSTVWETNQWTGQRTPIYVKNWSKIENFHELNTTCGGPISGPVNQTLSTSLESLGIDLAYITREEASTPMMIEHACWSEDIVNKRWTTGSTTTSQNDHGSPQGGGQTDSGVDGGAGGRDGGSGPAGGAEGGAAPD